MSPPAPPPVDHEAAQRAGDVLEFLAKFVGSAGVLWAFMDKVWKPYQEWRRRRMAELMREVLKDELGQLRALIQREDGCADRLERVVEQVTELFSEHDLLMDVAIDNRDRLDETNELLDAVGLANERRDAKTEITRMFDELAERRKARRRKLVPEV